MNNAKVEFLLPLSVSEIQPQVLAPDLMTTPAEKVFPNARDAKAALAGHLLLHGHWDLSHQISQNIESREGSYWHGIAHRIEPDSANAGYWFRRVGEHAIFSALHKDTEALLASAKTGWILKAYWDPYLFIEWCDEARGVRGSDKYRVACQIQRLECERLFSWCAGKTDGS